MIIVLNIAVYDMSESIFKKISSLSFWHQFKGIEFLGNKTQVQLEELLINRDVDVILAVTGQHSFSQFDFIRNVLSNYPDFPVIIISPDDRYEYVRNAFLMGVFDYLTIDNLEKTLCQSIVKIVGRRRNAYFTDKIYDKVILLARHIFDGGNNVNQLVHNIVENIYSDWQDDTITCQQVVEKVKQESYKHFIRKKPWLEKFIYRGDYIRDIGFEIKEKNEIEQELCRYYSEVNILFKKYNVIDVNKTIYTIGKSVIRQVDNKVTLESVANDVYLNKTYVSHIFKEMTGIRFNDFVNEVKIDRAKTLLHYPDLSISEIAEMLCFCNTGYFSSQFRTHTGVSPSEYRQIVKK